MPTEAQKVMSHSSDDAYLRAKGRERQRELDKCGTPDSYLRLARGHVQNLVAENKLPTKESVAKFLREFGCKRDKIKGILSQLGLDKSQQGEMFAL